MARVGNRPKGAGAGSMSVQKTGLITGTAYRACDTCGKHVFVPAVSDWKTCGPCRHEEKK